MFGTLPGSFYDTVMASAIFYAIDCSGGGSMERDRKFLNRLVKRASFVWCIPLGSIEDVGGKRLMSIMDPLHETVEGLTVTALSQVLHPNVSQTVQYTHR